MFELGHQCDVCFKEFNIFYTFGCCIGIGHTLGRPKASWGKEGHRGQVIVDYPATLDGLKEAERLENHFKSCHRGREEWLRVKCMWHGLPGHEGIPEGPDLKRIDKDSMHEKRVLYGYLAKIKDLDKLPLKKKNKKCISDGDPDDDTGKNPTVEELKTIARSLLGAHLKPEECAF